MMTRESCFLYLFVIAVSSLSILTHASAPSMSLTKSSPEGNPVVGDTVILQCSVSNLQAGHIIEWVRRVSNADVILSNNGTSLVSRYAVFASSTEQGYEHLIINTAEQLDTGLYKCRVKNSTDGSGMVLLSKLLYLSVHYFPGDIYPICKPQGPFTVQQGTTHNITCTSEKGNPMAQMDFISSGTIYPLEYSSTAETQTTSLNVRITANVNDIVFECKISSPDSFPNEERSCIIGPIHVSSSMINEMSTVAAQIPTTQLKKSTTALFAWKTSSLTPSTSSSSDTLVTSTVIGVSSSMQRNEAQTSKTNRMTTAKPHGTSLQAVTYSTTASSNTDGVVPLSLIIAGIAGGGGLLLFLVLMSIVIACACLRGFQVAKKEKHTHLLPASNSTRPNTISRPSSQPSVTRHPNNQSQNHVNNLNTQTGAGGATRPAKPDRLGTPKPSRAGRTHPESRVQPNTWELIADGLESEESGTRPSDIPTLRVGSHTERSDTSYIMPTGRMNQEPMCAQLQKSKTSSMDNETEKVHTKDTEADSSLKFKNPTYDYGDTQPAARRNGYVKTRLGLMGSAETKQVTWKA